MKNLIAALCAGLLLAGCAATAPGEDNPYNAGVAAWKRKDYAEAAGQWSRAVQAGNADAMNNLGFLYFNGLGTPVRKGDAIDLWRRAAVAAQPEAQTHLGWVYQTGDGIEQDRVRAYAWYYCSMVNAAARKADPADATAAQIAADAERYLDALGAQLSDGDLDQAKALAQEYARRYASPPP